MANKPLKSIKFPGLSDTYTVPQVDSTLTTSGSAADAKVAGDQLRDLKSAVGPLTLAELDWTDGKYLYVNSSNVVSEQSNENYSVTDYILIPAGVNVLAHTFYSGYASSVLYDANKNYSENYQHTSGVTYGVIDIEISASTVDRYLRITCYKPNKSNAFVSLYDSVADMMQMITNRLKVYGERISSSSQLASLADAQPNTVYTFTASVEESQPNAAGTLFTFNCTNDNNSGHTQIFVAWNGKMYKRIKWNRSGTNSFNAWTQVLDPSDITLCMKAYGSRISSSSQLASLADATPNTVYTFTSSVEASQPSASGTLLTLNSTSDNNGGHTQIFVSSTNEMFSRIKWSNGSSTVFTDWAKMASSTTFMDDMAADATMFERIGVVGDSFASGVIYATGATTEEGKNYTHYEQSWPQCLGRICGNTVINYSVGGCTTKGWINNTTYGKAKMESDDPCDLYLLCLGINDMSGVSLGDIEDIGDTEEDTFYRWYGEIVDAIHNHAPKALIVFSTFCRSHQASDTAYTSYNEAIQELAEYYEVPCLLLTDDPFFNSSYYIGGMHNSHPTAAQYSGYAKAINRLLAKSIVDNYSYYSDYNSTPSTI